VPRRWEDDLRQAITVMMQGGPPMPLTPESGHTAGAMSQENVQIVRRVFDAFNRRDIAAFLELLDPDVEWVPILAVLEGRVYRGHEEIRRWIKDLATDWEFFEVYYEELRDLGDRVLVSGHWRAHGRASGIEVENPGTYLYEIKGGKVVLMRTFTDRAEALEAAGLEE
jgi:ketosteroid isomerase-like protein